MRTIDVEKLLAETLPDEPSGSSLEYDPLFLEMEQAAQGKAEQEIGGQKTPAEEPNWREVKEHALELASRTKDLRVAAYLTRAIVRADGLGGLRDSLELLVGYVDQYWETLHPLLEEDLDPTMRLNALAALQDPDALLKAIQEAPLVQSPVVGAIRFRDVLVARGELATSGDAEPPSEAVISGVFADCDLEDLQETGETCAGAREAVGALTESVSSRLDAGFSIDLSGLAREIDQIHGFLADQLAARGVGTGSDDEEIEGEGRAASESGAIQSREDVVRALERISRYYETHEPASPIPLLMDRAKRLVHASFLDVVKDLAPAGVEQVESVGGIRRSDDD